MRALASHQCGPGLNPGVVLVLRVLRFSPILNLKTNTSKFQFDLERTDTFQRVPVNA